MKNESSLQFFDNVIKEAEELKYFLDIEDTSIKLTKKMIKKVDIDEILNMVTLKILDLAKNKYFVNQSLIDYLEEVKSDLEVIELLNILKSNLRLMIILRLLEIRNLPKCEIKNGVFLNAENILIKAMNDFHNFEY